MRIRDLYSPGKTILSLEVFPPKHDPGICLDGALSDIARLSPAFISVTVHASGSVEKTLGIAAGIQNEFGLPSMAHLTCVNSSRDTVHHSLEMIRGRGVENILALRGDPVEGGRADYRYASELIRDIGGYGGFCIGAACYPEGHIDSTDLALDIGYLKAKQDAGAEFFVSQLFFDNDVFFRFLERARAAGITVPVSAGVMPVLSRGQIEKMIFLCGASLPARVVRLLHTYQSDADSLRKAGTELAAEQVRGLMEAGVDGVHLYTMNKPEVAEWIFSKR
ncbi:MAG: methylenetetrahydrofolate reductase [Oscillospiraceae bacterium]|jgi:methylenetetrahydrofolate reductase (NADPH)|nr:methylenetetrahydrofolate reductase [Oscillospiraceae bacterium]